MVICNALGVSYYTYEYQKLCEYAFRGIGYAFQSQYCFMDYAAEVNSVALKNRDSVKDFAILKFIVFAKNYIPNMMFFADHAIKTFNIDALDKSSTSGLYYSFSLSGDQWETHMQCFDNMQFFVKYAGFVSFVQEVGMFSGGLAVDVSLMALKQIGVLKDANSLTIDPDYRRNVIMAAQKASTSLSHAVHNVYYRVAGRPRTDILDGKRITKTLDSPVRIEFSKKRKQVSSDARSSLDKEKVEKPYSIKLPQLPEHVVALEQTNFNAGNSVVFAINMYTGANSATFNEILANKGPRSPLKLLTVNDKYGNKVYELQDCGKNHRLIGPILGSTAAILYIDKAVGKRVASDIKHKFDDYAQAIEKKDWSCIVLKEYVAKHEKINQAALSIH